ncbi:alpha/beta fold hydrolase [Gammaproteobacteria bacterium]|nr:alpha/beta fold hydrolase [Gammaproteobacteria bacterium]MDC3323119.1 alpha/beta fold hydrolase [Gammaproteobacteria bacterium]
MKKLFILFFAWLVMNLSSEEGQITKLNGIDLWWDSYGDQKNPTVLMIMGLNSNSKVWSDQSIKELVDNDLHVLIYDNRDIGKSSWVTEEPGLITFIKYLPAFLIESFVNFIFDFIFDEEGKFNMENPSPAEYNLSDMAMDGVSLLDHVGVSEAHIVGASMGGMIAQVMALEHPARIKSLTLFFSTPGFDTPGLSGPSENFKMAMKESFVLNLLGKEEEALIVTEKSLAGSRYPFDEANFTKEAKIRLKQGINTSNAQIAAVGASPNRASSLQEINRPTLIIHGSEDPLIPVDHGIYLQQNIPNAKKLILEGVGHEIPDQALSEIIPVMLNHFKL